MKKKFKFALIFGSGVYVGTFVGRAMVLMSYAKAHPEDPHIVEMNKSIDQGKGTAKRIVNAFKVSWNKSKTNLEFDNIMNRNQMED